MSHHTPIQKFFGTILARLQDLRQVIGKAVRKQPNGGADMKVYLAMMFLVQGQWIDGATLEGWAPREQPSMEVCLDRARVAMTEPPPAGVEWLSANCQAVAGQIGCMSPDRAAMMLSARLALD